MVNIVAVNIENNREIAPLCVLESDVIAINYHKEIIFSKFYEIPQAIKIVRTLSFETGKVVTICAKVKIDDEDFYSVAVFDGGYFMGIADAITEKDVSKGKSIKVFSAGGVKFGVSVGKDFICPQSANCFSCGADFILHQTLDEFSGEYVKAVKGHGAFCDEFVSVYSDVVVKNDTRAECVPLGEPFAFDVRESPARPPIAFLKLGRLE